MCFIGTEETYLTYVLSTHTQFAIRCATFRRKVVIIVVAWRCRTVGAVFCVHSILYGDEQQEYSVQRYHIHTVVVIHPPIGYSVSVHLLCVSSESHICTLTI